MNLYDTLAKAQRNFIAAVFSAWLVALIAMVTAPPQLAILIGGGTIAIMLAAFVYLYRAARCPHCHGRLWLSLHKLVPLGPLRPKLNHCPFCGIQASDRAAV